MVEHHIKYEQDKISDIWDSHGSYYQNNVFLDGIIPDIRQKVPLYHK
jgi:hypothetical protein